MIEDLPDGLRYFENLACFECLRCGKWMYGLWKTGEPVPSDVLMHVDSHRRPRSSLREAETPEKAKAPPLPPEVKALLDMIDRVNKDAAPVSIVHRDGKIATGISMKLEHWRVIVYLAAQIKNQ